MRVTEQQTFGVLVNNLERSRARSLELQQQLSTGKKVRMPSDDPSAFNRISLDKASVASIDQRLRNISFGRTRLDLSDKLLSSTTDTLSRVQELAVQFGSDTNGPAERVIGSSEVRQLYSLVQQYANAELNGQAVFTGTSTRGRTTGLAITTPVTLTNGTNDSLVVSIDGVTSGTIDLASATGSLTGAALAARVQTQINADTALTAAGKHVTVTFETDHLVIASDAHGSDSTVTVTGGTSRATLGLVGGSRTTGDKPFALTATTSPGSTNTGGALINQGTVVDDNLVTLDDYVIRFSSATQYDVLDVTVPVNVTKNGANTGGAFASDAGIIGPANLTLNSYAIQFTSSTQYNIVNTTTSATVSSGNTYVSGNAIEFDGLRIVLTNSDRGGPQSGDAYAVSLTPRTVLANQTYSTGSDISFDGIRLQLSTGSGAPATGDRFAVVTGLQYQGDAGVHQVEVGNNQVVPTNVSGDRVFSGPNIDLFASIKTLMTSLRTNYRGGIRDTIGDVGTGLSQAGAVLGEVGALSNRLTGTAGRLDEFKTFFTQTLSETEDVDLAKAISDLTLQQYAIEAASRTLNQLFGNSLLKYLQ
jgi:flagellin-like hook-associated protein FlgL